MTPGKSVGRREVKDGEIHYSVPAFLIEQSGTMITIVTIQTRDFYRLTNLLFNSASKMYFVTVVAESLVRF